MQELFAPSAQMLCLTPALKGGACAKRLVNKFGHNKSAFLALSVNSSLKGAVCKVFLQHAKSFVLAMLY
jgi:hypothetical protein